jgi:8-hydroxy-5-deazaflavin:NADPH oxidoreductase
MWHSKLDGEARMKIGVLGSGNVAKTLAGGFIKHGHQVVLGTRDTGKLKEFVAQHQGAQTGSFADAAKFGDVVVLAVKGTVALDALKAAGAANLAGTRHRPTACLNFSLIWTNP